MSEIKTIIITADPNIAADAEAAGVSRIMVDLESHGKKERQASRNTFISTHTKDDIKAVRNVLKKAQLIVRINPWHNESQSEIEHAIGEGADIIMLPMITSLSHIEGCLELVQSRAQTLPLIETGYSMAQIGHIADQEAIPEIYIGLNDLHLSLGLDFLFEPLGLGLIDWMANQITSRGKRFGFGGIATMGSGELPAEAILGEHVRVGSSCVILSSRFCNDIDITSPIGRQDRLTQALSAMHAKQHELQKRTALQQHDDAKRTAAIIQSIAAKARTRGSF